jgi:SAM-dependent methyltransferase
MYTLLNKYKHMNKKDKVIRVCDLGCGENKQNPNWFGVDCRKLKGVDLVQDLEKFPWRIKSETFNLVVANHLIEHINPAKGGFISFMNEVWRILKPEGEFMISAPYATSPGMYRDPTHINFINEETWCSFDNNDPFYKGELYKIYKPLPWKIKINTWNDTGNIEVVLIKRPIENEKDIDQEYLKNLKKYNKMFK